MKIELPGPAPDCKLQVRDLLGVGGRLSSANRSERSLIDEVIAQRRFPEFFCASINKRALRSCGT